MVEPHPNVDITHSIFIGSKLLTNILPGEFALDDKSLIVQ